MPTYKKTKQWHTTASNSENASIIQLLLLLLLTQRSFTDSINSFYLTCFHRVVTVICNLCPPTCQVHWKQILPIEIVKDNLKNPQQNWHITKYTEKLHLVWAITLQIMGIKQQKNNAPAHSNLSITGINTAQHTFYAYKYQAAFCQRIYNTNGNFSPLCFWARNMEQANEKTQLCLIAPHLWWAA